MSGIGCATENINYYIKSHVEGILQNYYIKIATGSNNNNNEMKHETMETQWETQCGKYPLCGRYTNV